MKDVKCCWNCKHSWLMDDGVLNDDGTPRKMQDIYLDCQMNLEGITFPDACCEHYEQNKARMERKY